MASAQPNPTHGSSHGPQRRPARARRLRPERGIQSGDTRRRLPWWDVTLRRLACYTLGMNDLTLAIMLEAAACIGWLACRAYDCDYPNGYDTTIPPGPWL
jgi:hypothetical protein